MRWRIHLGWDILHHVNVSAHAAKMERTIVKECSSEIFSPSRMVSLIDARAVPESCLTRSCSS